MNLENLIRSLQRRIALRSNQISTLEIERTAWKEAGKSYVAFAVSDEIKPLAKAQKEDKMILDNLCAQRTMHEFMERHNAVISIEIEGKTMNV